ncbi:SAM-dependent chlorinase/fluorinase [Candidatus Bathyarchaeota archaeon]|nr:SAM-dependent chlorinase/fluorinase [Candidatus Bathyarchaeota archaeon]
MALVALLSDFGVRDPYVAQMKGVILTISPPTIIVDISHEVERHNVQEGMLLLASTAQYFPAGTIYVAVVDPGVGGSRRPILIQTRRGLYVGPDNGLLTMAAEMDGIIRVYHLTESKYFAVRVSPTFHGRDIFAYVAGHLARGVEPSKFGQPITDYMRIEFPKVEVRCGEVLGSIIHIDRFGNIVSNIRYQNLESENIRYGGIVDFEIDGKNFSAPLCHTYVDVPSGDILATIGSSGFLEVAVCMGDAAKLLNVNVGASIMVRRHKPK